MRKLTVSYRNETRTGQGYGSSRYISVPYLPLSGKWLEQAGFEIGSKVQVEVKDGQLVIKKSV